MGSLNFIGSVVRKAISLYRVLRANYSSLAAIKLGNPTCIIHNCSLQEIRLGEYVTILDASFLQKVRKKEEKRGQATFRVGMDTGNAESC